MIRLKSQGLVAQFVRGSSGSLIIRLASSVMALASTIILTRILGLQEWGTYSFTISWLTTLVLIGRLGFNKSATRYIASYASLKKWGELTGFIQYCIRTVYKTSIGIALLSMLVIFAAGGIIKGYYNDDGFYNTVLVAMLILPFVAHLEVNEGILDGFKRVALSQVPMRLLRPSLIAIGLLGIFYWTSFGQRTYEVEGEILRVVTAETAMTINLVASVLALMLAVRFRKSVIQGRVVSTPPVYHKKEWLVTSRDMMLTSAFYLIFVQADVMMLGILVGEEAVGLYTVAARIATLLILALNSVNAILQPMVSELYSNKKFDELQRIVSIGASAVFGISLIGCLILFFGAGYLDLIFGPEFGDSDNLLMILMVGQLVNAFAGPAVLLLNMTGHQRRCGPYIGCKRCS